MLRVRRGDMVQIHYTGRLSSGQVFDSTIGRSPLEFRAGGDEIIVGVSEAVIGMVEGEDKDIVVRPESGYGPRHPELEHEVPRAALPESARPGDPLRARSGENVIQVWVKKLADETAIVDANHPLAGETLHFHIKLVALVRPNARGRNSSTRPRRSHSANASSGRRG